MWEIHVADQVLSFALSAILGAILCLCYDILRALRKSGFNSYWAVFITDILFWVCSAYFTFVFYMAKTNGEIRGYVLLGELLGFIVCRITLSRLIFIVLVFIFEKISRIYNFANKHIILFYMKTERIFIKLLTNILKKLLSLYKSIKKLLKNDDKLVYTDYNNVNVESIVDESKTSKRRKQKTTKTQKG